MLGVSRSAVWKRLLLLEESTGLRIHKVRGKGYRLERPLILLDSERLSRELPYPVKVLTEVDSTNAEALRHLAVGQVNQPLLFVAEQQTAGRGRRGRSWVSPYGVNLYFSLLLPVSDSSRLEGLSLLVGLAVRRALVACGYLGVDNRTGRKFSWLSDKKYTSEAELRADLAIRHDWGVKITSVSTFAVPKGTWVSEGAAAAQGAGYPGGGYQAVITNLPKSWVTRTDRAF